MRILYDSKKEHHKSPFGCLKEDEKSTLRIHIPKSCLTESVYLIIKNEEGFSMTIPFSLEKTHIDYEIYKTDFSLFSKGLYFYYFKIKTQNEEFDLYKDGDETNIGLGDLWQLTCYDKNYDTPSSFKGKIMYQIFPDRFFKRELSDIKGKLEPYVVHENTDDIPVFLPNENGRIVNNDFFGGNLKGITEKLPYLKELGIGIIYLNPIFYAYSNHRYDTADYKRIDPLLGTEKDFSELCKNAHSLDIKIILDGVFSHTGSNSIYFDSEHIFKNGAVSSENSPYKPWFSFERYPDKYTSWWGIDTLPCVNELDDSYMDYIIYSDDSVISHWINLGADGFRLDVADELPDEFILAFKKRLLELKPDSLLIGEVWEDASNKISYSKRRKYFSSSELDSVMNYPFKDAIIGFICGYINGFEFKDRIITILENYPKPVVDCLMNILSTHDTCRILTQLSGIGFCLNKTDKSKFSLEGKDLERATMLSKAAALIQFTLPGNPCIYYGDEIGMEGFEDPLNRAFFKWKNINNDLHLFYKKLTQLKNNSKALKYGNLSFVEYDDKFLLYLRTYEDETIYIKISLSGDSFDKENGLLDISSEYVNAVIYKKSL